MLKLWSGLKNDFYNILLAINFIQQQSLVFPKIFIYSLISFLCPFLLLPTFVTNGINKHSSKCRSQFYSKYFVTFEVNLSFKLGIFYSQSSLSVFLHTNTNTNTNTKTYVCAYKIQTTVVLFGQRMRRRQIERQRQWVNGRARGNRCVNDESPRWTLAA